jgi:cytochrome c peroxidase
MIALTGSVGLTVMKGWRLNQKQKRALAWGAALIAAAGLWLFQLTGSVAQTPSLTTPQRLGARLFNDVRLSTDGSISCASCHVSGLAFTDGRVTALGIQGKAGLRNTPTLLNMAAERQFFWDGRRDSLEALITDPLTNPVEHGLADVAAVIKQVSSDPMYQKEFASAFGGAVSPDAVTAERLRQAIADFVRTLVSPPSAIDRFIIDKDTQALSNDARAGFELFKGKAQCAGCHRVEPDATTGRVLLTDHSFHPHGTHVYGREKQLALAARQLLDQGLKFDSFDPLTNADIEVMGRFIATRQIKDVGAFKTPSLRNVAHTAPYFHGGAAATLEQALDNELNIPGSEINLTPQERQQMLSFLKELSDDPVTYPGIPNGR